RVARTVRCDSGSPGSRLDNLLVVDVEPMGAKTERVLELIEEEIRRLQTELVMPDELAKSRTQIEAEFLWGIATNEGLAQQLAYFQTVAGDWRYLVRHSAMIHGIGAEDLQRVARRYLLSTNRTVAELVKR
ncbi:MAG: insulinase family protein, partial [Deltaproteobacteria bacterium]|nr:insulinase family protein [Deltaproteobacteria bacterium]